MESPDACVSQLRVNEDFSYISSQAVNKYHMKGP